MSERDQAIPLDIDQILLRGSSLRNTEYIYGIALYTGHDTKIMQNSSKSRSKHSKIELAMNRYIVLSILIQVSVCLFAATYTVIWQNIGDRASSIYYLGLEYETTNNIAVDIMVNFFKWFLIMMNFVSISLLVSLEMVKFI